MQGKLLRNLLIRRYRPSPVEGQAVKFKIGAIVEVK